MNARYFASFAASAAMLSAPAVRIASSARARRRNAASLRSVFSGTPRFFASMDAASRDSSRFASKDEAANFRSGGIGTPSTALGKVRNCAYAPSYCVGNLSGAAKEESATRRSAPNTVARFR